MTHVLCVGNVTLDIVNRVERYPDEDSEVRASAHAQRIGGNAANTAIVLAQLGVRSSWVGNLVQSAEPVERGFAGHGVDASLAVRVADAHLPTSYILLSELTGSRSIVHYRDLPEYRAEDFHELDLRNMDWVHFEGRAVDQLASMVRRARTVCGLPVSLEVEKPRVGIEDLFGQVDLLMFSHDYARAHGFADAAALLRGLPAGVPATCTWGAEGAWAVDHDGRLTHAAAPQLDSVIDSLGAGDVFNAAMVHGLSSGLAFDPAVQQAVNLASAQCTRDGLDIADQGQGR